MKRDFYAKLLEWKRSEDPTLKDFFLGRLQPERILEKLSIYYETKILPHKTRGTTVRSLRITRPRS